MNNDLRFRFADYFEEQCFIEYIHDRWLNAEVEKHGCLFQRTRRANHRPTLIDEQPTEPAANSPTRSCDKYSSFHASVFATTHAQRRRPRGAPIASAVPLQ